MNSWIITSFLLLLLVIRSFGLNTDGILLLSFKYSVLKDPLMVLKNWNYEDHNPCSWNGVRCSDFSSLPPGSSDTNRVISLILPQSKLLGSIPANLGMIQHLQYLDLSSNFLNGSLPFSLFNASELKLLSLSNNAISGQLPDFVVDGLKSLETLNLSDNALTGNLPTNLSSLQNVRVISLKNNYLFGEIPSGFENVEFLDLSSNLINGSLPENIGGNNLHYLNLSSNKISGEIPLEFGNRIPESATIDISFNNLTGEVPETKTFLSQETNSFSSNPDLCGKILRNPCKIPSSSSTLNNSPPAIAAIPTTPDSSLENGSKRKDRNRLKPGSIVGIVVGDLVGIGILAMVFLYVYKLRKKKKQVTTNKITEKTEEETSNSSGNSCFCLGNRCVNDEESSETTNSEEEDEDDEEEKVGLNQKKKNQQLEEEERKKGKLVIVDGETELELETLLKASAYILGTTGSSIVYKAVLEDGTVLAVRRIGETGFERFRDFENQVRGIAKLKHPNLVNIRGFYWGSDEKLVIYDHVPNGNLANVTYKRGGSSPYHLPWEVRLKIAKGVARGLTYLHDKKHVHSNLKPTNILLGLDMDPKISDFGLGKLMWGESSHKAGGSARSFSSKRWLVSRESQQDLATSSTPSPSSVGGGSSLYQAPESLRNLKPNPKWDVYSFGMVLLELLSGKIFCDTELAHWEGGIVLEERSRVLRMADLAIRGDVVEDDLITCFKLGFSCASVVAAKRPSMKEVLQVLETISSSSSLRYYDY